MSVPLKSPSPTAPTKASSSATSLSDETTSASAPQVDAPARAVFEREGWLLVKGLLDTNTLHTLLVATQALEHQAREFVYDTLVKGVFFEMQSQSGKKREPAVCPGALRKVTSPSKGQPAFAKLRNDPRVLEALTRCGLSAPQCLIDQVNFKLPLVGTCFPYHQDEAFLFGEALSRVQQFGGINLVIALDPADETNGGFEVLGRTHTNGIATLDYDGSRMSRDVFDESYRALPPLAPGDAILFHPRLAHGSQSNRSHRPRRLVTLWYGGRAAPSPPKCAAAAR